MARALLLAERGRGRTSPNPMVGAVVVDDDGVVVGRGSHERAGGPHAEVHALDDAGDRARGATLYCTLEPCSHTGRTGPCAPRVVEAGIRRAVIAVEDPNPRVRGRGSGVSCARTASRSGRRAAEEAARLNRPFFTYIQQRPAVRHAEGGAQPRRHGRRTARHAHGAHRSRGQLAACTTSARRSTRSRSVGDGARRRSAADGARRVPPSAARARRVRSTAADAADGAAVLDARRGPVIMVEYRDGRRCASRPSDALAPPAPSSSSSRSPTLTRRSRRPGSCGRARSTGGARASCRSSSKAGPRCTRVLARRARRSRRDVRVAARRRPGGVEWSALPDGSIASLTALTAMPVGDDVRSRDST